MALIINIWQQPELCKNLSNKQWELLVKQAKASQVIASLGCKLQPFYDSGFISDRVWHHFSSSILLIEKQKLNTEYELSNLNTLLSKLNKTAILLKGAAYCALNLPVSLGRVFTDIDLLVPKEDIAILESELWFNGFMSTTESDYDKRYYRTWMHEIQPLQHINRKTILDVHHNILPLTSKTKISLEPLKEQLKSLPEYPYIKTLSDEALILHSATHLFHEGEFEKGFRDLTDLASLLNSYLEENSSYEHLITMAKQSGLGRQLFFACRYTKAILDTKIPQPLSKELSSFQPNFLSLKFLDFYFLRALTPHHGSLDSLAKRFSCQVLYLRGHLLRMPLMLLIPHLVKKSYSRINENIKNKNDNRQQAL
ncbi:nucleotidyltransferase domain-containing protein [Colwellia sp. MEBiC06753]